MLGVVRSLVLVALLCCLSSTTFAASILIDNSSFETPSLSDGRWVYTAPDWSISGSAGIIDPPATMFPAGAPDGENIAFVNGGTLSQVLPESLLPNSLYTLQVDVGRRLDRNYSTLPTYSIGLYAGGVLLEDLTASLGGLVKGQFATQTVTYETGASVVPGSLEVRLTSSGPQTNFDDVNLSVEPLGNGNVVPLPSVATSTMLLGLLAGLARRRV